MTAPRWTDEQAREAVKRLNPLHYMNDHDMLRVGRALLTLEAERDEHKHYAVALRSRRDELKSEVDELTGQVEDEQEWRKAAESALAEARRERDALREAGQRLAEAATDFIVLVPVDMWREDRERFERAIMLGVRALASPPAGNETK